MYNKVSLLVGKAGSRVTIIVTKAKSLFPDNGAGFCPCYQKRNPEQSFHFPLIYSSSGNSKERSHHHRGWGCSGDWEEQGRSSQASSPGLPSPTTHIAGQSRHPGSPSSGHQAPPGNGNRTIPGQDVGAWTGLALGNPWPGMAELWGAGHRPCCSIAGVLRQQPWCCSSAEWGSPRGPDKALVTAGSPTMAVPFPLNLHVSPFSHSSLAQKKFCFA